MYKIVIIDSIWDSIDQCETTQKYLAKLIKAKKKGYYSRHTHDYLALGTEDFICSHIMICKKIDNDWEPICLSKVINSKNLIKYNIPHPMLKISKGFYQQDYYNQLEECILGAMREGRTISYSGGFTIVRDLLENKAEVETLKEIYTGIHQLFHEKNEIEKVFGFACPRLNTDKFFATWGYTPLNFNLDEAPSAYPDDLHNEEVVSIVGDISNVSFHTKRMAQKYLYLWNERIQAEEAIEVSQAA